MVATISEALSAMRRLATTNAGRLAGVNLVHAPGTTGTPTGGPDWPGGLNRLLAARAAGTVTGATPAYLVTSDRYPICWLTADAAIVTPMAALSRNQAKHQRLVTEALVDLCRYAVGRLADHRDLRDGRPADIDTGARADRVGSVRVANPSARSRAWWVPIGPDLPDADRRITDATGSDPPLIIAAHGYGRYGREARRLHLDTLCAINAAAGTYDLPADAVGDWLTAEGPDTVLPAADITAAFADAYLGRFSHRLAYTQFRLGELGWERALRHLGALEFFDTPALDHHLFSNEVRAINDSGRPGGIVVCRRAHPR